MSGVDEVLEAISSAIDDRLVSCDAMRSGPDLEPDLDAAPPVVALLLAAIDGELPSHADDTPLTRAEAIVMRLIMELGMPG